MTTAHTEIGPTADDWAFYGKVAKRRVAKPSGAANDNRLTADRVAALVRYRNEPDHPFEPMSSGWSVTPSGIVEYYDDDEGGEPQAVYHTELELEVRPSTREILRAMRKDWTWYKPAEEYEGEPVEKIGSLRFSNGETRERMLKTGPDGQVGTYLCKMPKGALLGATEKNGGPKGEAATPRNATISNLHLTRLLLRRDARGNLIDPPLAPRQFIPKGKMQERTTCTKAETRALIADAIANTPVMPAITYCPPGIASGTARYSDQFIGMKPKTSGKSGAIGWVDFFVAGRDRAEWLELLEGLRPEVRATLDKALEAESLAEVGIAAGQSPEYARRKGGKRVLVAANDNLAQKIEDIAA